MADRRPQDFIERLLQKPSFDDEFNPFGPKSQEILERIQHRMDNPIYTGPYLTKRGRLIGESKANLCPQFDNTMHM